MSVEHITRYIDNIDGTPLEEGNINEIELMYRGNHYSLHLSNDNAAKLDAALAPFIEHATVIGLSPTKRKQINSEIRAFLKTQNIKVSDKGRIPADLVALYEEAQRGNAPTDAPTDAPTAGPTDTEQQH